MTGWLRRAGVAALPDGSSVGWSVAEGRAGRRWRWRTIGPTGELRGAGLVELSPAGDLGRIEFATAAGLLTVHPEPDDGRLHGNVVGPDGVRPISLDWRPGDSVAVEGSVVLPAILGRPVVPDAIGQGRRGIRIAFDLSVSVDDRAIEPDEVARDADGVPVAFGERAWPLE